MTNPEDMRPAPVSPGDEFSDGCAWVSGDYLPIDRAGMPLTDAGITRSDLTYDVVAVWEGRFFRLDDHIDRLLRGCDRIHLTPPLTREQIRDVLIGCVRRSGLRQSYVEAIVTRGIAARGVRDPRQYKAQFYAYAIPYIWISDPDQQNVGTDLVVARQTIRIPAGSVDPTVKNFHWGDLTRGMFEAFDRGAMTPVLPDGNGNATEGPGFNIFAVLDETLSTPAHGVLEGITRQTVLEIAERIRYPDARHRPPGRRPLPRQRDLSHQHRRRHHASPHPRRQSSRRRSPRQNHDTHPRPLLGAAHRSPLHHDRRLPRHRHDDLDISGGASGR